MLGIGPMEMVIILLLALLVLGPRRLPEMMRTFGRLMAELRKTADEVRDELMFDEDLQEIKQTVRDMQDLSANAVEKLIREGERELALEEDEGGQGTEPGREFGEIEETGEQGEEEAEKANRG
jgi:Tat protein translocase TatB subunit